MYWRSLWATWSLCRGGWEQSKVWEIWLQRKYRLRMWWYGHANSLWNAFCQRKFVFWFFDIHENLHLGFRFWTKKLFCSDLRKKIIWFWLWKVLFFSFVNFMNILWILWISWISEFHEFHEFREVMNFWISRILWISRLFEKSLKMLYLNFYAEMKLFNAA